MCGLQSGCLPICLLSAVLRGGAGETGLLVLLRAQLEQKLTEVGSKRGGSASQGHWEGGPRVHRALSWARLSDTACQSPPDPPCTLAPAPCSLASSADSAGLGPCLAQHGVSPSPAWRPGPRSISRGRRTGCEGAGRREGLTDVSPRPALLLVWWVDMSVTCLCPSVEE